MDDSTATLDQPLLTPNRRSRRFNFWVLTPVVGVIVLGAGAAVVLRQAQIGRERQEFKGQILAAGGVILDEPPIVDAHKTGWLRRLLGDQAIFLIDLPAEMKASQETERFVAGATKAATGISSQKEKQELVGNCYRLLGASPLFQHAFDLFPEAIIGVESSQQVQLLRDNPRLGLIQER
jgi:hypothetical protein